MENDKENGYKIVIEILSQMVYLQTAGIPCDHLQETLDYVIELYELEEVIR